MSPHRQQHRWRPDPRTSKTPVPVDAEKRFSILSRGFRFFTFLPGVSIYIFNQTFFTLGNKSTNHKKGGGTRVKTRTLVPPMFIGQSVTFLKILALTLDLKKKKRCQELEQMQLRIGNCREKNHLFIHIWFGSIG